MDRIWTLAALAEHYNLPVGALMRHLELAPDNHDADAPLSPNVLNVYRQVMEQS